METNKILFITVSVVIYALLSIFVIKTITKHFRKSAFQDDNYNYYAIILSGLILSSGLFGKELFGVLNDTFSIIQKNNSGLSDFYRTASVFAISGIIMNSIAYYLSFILLKIIFEKVKIKNQYASDQFGYFLVFTFLIIMLSLISIPLYHEFLILFSPKLEVGLYN
ncbi:hypothetical protein [Halpernia frigidisoli]|uniref:Uncharacterized protein n=1 Tax=Halpernia frigidisoli TaxID=1125876 RepID=A0A1I3HGW1_9FLAO|nr:hypothetical protein [Halpernia frigidisoli]SFI34966.1 hypothetical protein SAMN05443292_2201 [Halpernia frigidisoli]